ncbi:hypothetical protein EYF80_008691 [Liparis tanakae]|uniref:Uncharacterized protein n=1 Tax=Liparis tanakae TaxID=230148 RepID=A0A4Z2IT03_9TELE|nr:hypothetical protein EYF80_008691 [Liparis tanakae]
MLKTYIEPHSSLTAQAGQEQQDKGDEPRARDEDDDIGLSDDNETVPTLSLDKTWLKALVTQLKGERLGISFSETLCEPVGRKSPWASSFRTRATLSLLRTCQLFFGRMFIVASETVDAAREQSG